MKKFVRLGSTGIEVNRLGLGGIPIGRQEVSEQEAVKVIRGAIDAGINLIDTFSAYGRSEVRIGQALGDLDAKVTLVTKSRARLSQEEFVQMIEGSLRTLQVDCIDILLIKNIDDDARLARAESHLKTLKKCQEQGKVRFIGLSSHSPEHACRAIESGYIDVAEVPYNYANRHFEKVLDLAAERNVGILAMKPLGGSRLFPEVPKGAPETLETLVNALSFAISHPSNPVVIPGIGTLAELERYLEAMPLLKLLSAEQKDELHQRAHDLGDDFCRACGYCRPVCPAGIPIDEILPLLDRAQHVRTDGTYKHILKKQFLELAVAPNPCEECQQCIEECPYNLPVPERLKEAFEIFTAG